MKKELRQKIIFCRDRLTRGEIIAKSKKIAKRLYTLEEYRKALTVMFFLSFGSEVDTRSMVEESMARGKIVVVPKTVPEKREMIPSRILDYAVDLAPGIWGIPEPHAGALRPVSPEKIDIVVVPGVAFDGRGGRLGYGGGYYDRFFTLLSPNIPLVAVAFDLQLVDSLPVDPWDRLIDVLVTESAVFQFTKK